MPPAIGGPVRVMAAGAGNGMAAFWVKKQPPSGAEPAADGRTGRSRAGYSCAAARSLAVKDVFGHPAQAGWMILMKDGQTDYFVGKTPLLFPGKYV